MLRLLPLSLLVALLAAPTVSHAASPPSGTSIATEAAHPLVGAWVFDSDVQVTDDPPIYLLIHADGTLLVANPYFGDGVGVWHPTGAHTADATAVFQDLNPDPNQVVPGTLTARLAIELDTTGNVFAARVVSEGRWPDGTLAQRDESIGRGTRLVAESLPSFGTPAADGPTEAPSQPAPPATGPGSDDTPYPAARATHYGPEPGGFWLWEPTTGPAADAPVAEGPLPVVLYLDGCCDGDYPGLQGDAPLPTHLARRGYVIVAPVYRATTVLEDVPARLREALAELARPGHAAIDPSRFAVAGYSFGGVPAVTYAATAAAAGLPVPRALLVMAPCLDGTLAIGTTPESTCQVPPANLVFPSGLKALVLAFGQDFRVGIEMPRQVFAALAGLPAVDRDFVVMASDGRGQPPVLAQHETPTDGVDAGDWYGVWKLADALFACAFDGTWCEEALGNTPGQRFMGTWSDGVPVAELAVAEDTDALGA